MLIEGSKGGDNRRLKLSSFRSGRHAIFIRAGRLALNIGCLCCREYTIQSGCSAISGEAIRCNLAVTIPDEGSLGTCLTPKPNWQASESKVTANKCHP